MAIPHYHVVAAIIWHEGRILCMQRGVSKYDYISYKYEFPGGKVESGESLEEALIREVREEIQLGILIGDKFHTLTHEYPDFGITLEVYRCSLTSIDTLTLTEHIYHQWLYPEELTQLDWAAADLPIVAKLAGNI